MKKNDVLIEEIMKQVSEIPVEYQERILDILRGMTFTKKCLTRDLEKSNEIKVVSQCPE